MANTVFSEIVAHAEILAHPLGVVGNIEAHAEIFEATYVVSTIYVTFGTQE